MALDSPSLVGLQDNRYLTNLTASYPTAFLVPTKSKHKIIFKNGSGAGDIAQWLRALTALAAPKFSSKHPPK